MSDLAWVPRSCTLPTAERPLRVAEWDALFAAGPVSLSRPEPLRLRLVLAGGPEVGERVRELAERESGCCSFFTFTTGRGTDRVAGRHRDRTAGRLWLDIAVDPAHAAVLDALAARIDAVAAR
ncbi:hypothetical protein OG946_21640 [Streptomyces sp. NBC_01808]|uniref:hypothetical protein n=1 Tax=Streptomyces sp. NBC_01808 TaxID=2975947 RepID=UPI002DDC4214|nr:hypothetical protein [Streptomyces sp. NBC_01808]WSA39741.1 hypothetical protein OG946_21640 [Streptomyces sp. NBC_01808]